MPLSGSASWTDRAGRVPVVPVESRRDLREHVRRWTPPPEPVTRTRHGFEGCSGSAGRAGARPYRPAMFSAPILVPPPSGRIQADPPARASGHRAAESVNSAGVVGITGSLTRSSKCSRDRKRHPQVLIPTRPPCPAALARDCSTVPCGRSRCSPPSPLRRLQALPAVVRTG